MVRKTILCLVFVGLGTGVHLAGVAAAQPVSPSGGGPATSGPGTVESGGASSPSKMKCWVIRSGGEAFVIKINGGAFGSPSEAVIRQYALNSDKDGYIPTDIQLDIGGIVTAFSDPIEVVLEKHTTNEATLGSLKPDIEYFNLIYSPTGGAPVSVGTLRFVPGTAGRASSDITVRFSSAVMKSVHRDPCGGPPTDDMGEEEEIPALAATLTLLAAPSESP